MTNVSALPKTGISGVTFDSVYEAIQWAKELDFVPPNESDNSTVSGPVNAAKLGNLDVIRGAK